MKAVSKNILSKTKPMPLESKASQKIQEKKATQPISTPRNKESVKISVSARSEPTSNKHHTFIEQVQSLIYNLNENKGNLESFVQPKSLGTILNNLHQKTCQNLLATEKRHSDAKEQCNAYHHEIKELKDAKIHLEKFLKSFPASPTKSSSLSSSTRKTIR